MEIIAQVQSYLFVGVLDVVSLKKMEHYEFQVVYNM